MTGRVLFHVQHLLGIGHVQRARRIAEALAGLGIEVTLLSGGPPTPALDGTNGVRVVPLSPIRARDAGFALFDAAGEPVDDALRAARREQVLAAFAQARPDVVIVEGFPFARRAFRFELDPLIAAAHAARPRPRVVCSVRDIPTIRDDPERHRWIVARVRADFDAVLVHGDPRFIPFDVAFPAAAQIADRLVYTGYVAGPASASSGGDDVPAGEVLVSAGGGAAGRPLLEAALGACRLGAAAKRGWRILAGAGITGPALAALRQQAPPGVVVEPNRADFPALLRRCHVSVSQAGYNTVLDILAARVSAVLVPFAAGRETEQTIRAERVAARGAAVLLRETELSAAALAAAVDRAGAGAPAAIALDTAGAARAALAVAEMMTK